MHHSFNIVCDVNSRFVRLLFHLGCELNDGDNALLASAVGGHLEHVAPQLHIPLLSPSCPPGNFAFIDVENSGMKAPPFFHQGSLSLSQGWIKSTLFGVVCQTVSEDFLVWHARQFQNTRYLQIDSLGQIFTPALSRNLLTPNTTFSTATFYVFFSIEKQECSECCQQVEENLNKLWFNHLLQITSCPRCYRLNIDCGNSRTLLRWWGFQVGYCAAVDNFGAMAPEMRLLARFDIHPPLLWQKNMSTELWCYGLDLFKKICHKTMSWKWECHHDMY